MNTERTTPLSGARVLVVEDEYYLADDLSRALLQAGAEVIGPVGTLAEATQIVADGRFDCAIVDMNLRGDLAYPIAEQLKSARIPFIVATGYNQTSLPEFLQDVPRVEKPFAPHDVVRELTEMRRMPHVEA